MKELVALHKHWCVADSVAQFITAEVPADGKYELAPEHKALAQHGSQFMRLSVWYALLYVVIEGYQELGLEDEAIDFLLQREDLVDALRRFRNAQFHYQKDPINEKLLIFLEARDSTTWPRELNQEFKRYFEEAFPIRELLRDNSHT